ncbi:phosphate ABC transporter permease subunit PstC [Phreatobacter sp. AB_2022a]|uniref:phosphate ABC transporter permease subunit PstC n=1 Tax=Phreatobacter sp. AB_2022a TaxID=3003134 RepID=UPI002286F175|nr:phosphate ABC transporter permease subunit PstC [Phreatobacter sp. AB_2022a]MCZ0736544.1 phosphate ABC transporter permease subunit PstC [Phreatobacter sp. AB_2022a]
MTTVAEPSLTTDRSSNLARTIRRGQLADAVFHALLWASGALVLLILGAMIALLAYDGWPALRHFGAAFYTTAIWNPVTERFGAASMLFGTLVTAVIAVIVAVPVSFGIAFFLTEVCPQRLRKPIGVTIQLLAAVPSIIFGMWGALVVAPLIAAYIQTPLIAALSWLPVVGEVFAGPPQQFSVFTAGIILALMILPFITAMFVETLESVPAMLAESAYGIGATTWEVFRSVRVPYGRTAMVGAGMLGLGRALGETMAVTFVIGNANRISTSIFAPGSSIASVIANEFGEAQAGSLKLHALLQLGFALFVISFIVLAISRWLVRSRLD